MNHKTKKMFRLTGVAAATTAAAAATAAITTKRLVKLALDRNTKVFSPTAKRIKGTQTVNDFGEKRKECGNKLAIRKNEIVETVAQDGTPLVGHWIPCENAHRIIIAVHGWRSSWYKDFGMIADFFTENNCSVLYVEQRGQNTSGGTHMGLGLLERYDCLDWINWTLAHCGTEVPIYLFGISMGATTVLMATGLALPENIHGIVADCGFTSPDAIWRHVSDNNLHLPYRFYKKRVNKQFDKKIHFKTDDYSTVCALHNATVPVLFIHGTDDHFVPVEMTYENFKACASPKRMFIVPGASHGASYFIDRAGYEAAVKDFWRQYD